MTKRIKTVFKYASEVNHVWAAQSQSEGKTPARYPRNSGGYKRSSVHFQGTTLYSYSTPVANFVTNKKGVQACLITNRKYSVTTSANMPRVNDIPPNIPVFYTEHVGEEGGHAPYTNGKNFHVLNLDAMATDYRNKQQDLLKARVQVPYILSDIDERLRLAKEYSAFFGVKFPAKLFPAADQAVIEKAQARHQRAVQAQAEKDEANRVEKERIDREWTVQGIAWLAENPNAKLDDVPQKARNFIQTNADRVPEFGAFVTRCHAEEIAAWREGARDKSYNLWSVPTMLRVKDNVIETSRGASFPLEHGVKAYPFIKKCREESRGFITNGHRVHLGPFKIDRIETDGTVKAGCHIVQFAEIERVAKELGL